MQINSKFSKFLRHCQLFFDYFFLLFMYCLNSSYLLQAKSTLLVFRYVIIPLTPFAKNYRRKTNFCEEFNNYSCDNISKRLLIFFSSSCKVAYEACMHAYIITKKVQIKNWRQRADTMLHHGAYLVSYRKTK